MRVWVIVAVLVAGLVGCTSKTGEELPAVDAGSVEELETQYGIPLQNIPAGMTGEAYPENRGDLIGPHFEVQLLWRATAPALTDGGARSVPVALEPARAADGEELLLVAVERDFRNALVEGKSVAPEAELVIDGTATALERLPKMAEGVVPQGGVILMASVPVGKPVALRVTDVGRTQTLDVRTGDRGEDAIDLYYRDHLQELTTSTSLATGITTAQGHYPFDLTVEFLPPDGLPKVPTASLVPYQDTWAPDGRAWLVVPRPIATTPVVRGAPLYRLTVDNPTVFALRLPDGTVLPALPGGSTMDVSVDGVAINLDEPYVMFDVPADFDAGVFVTSLGAAPVTAITRDDERPGTWSPPPAPFEVPIAFQ